MAETGFCAACGDDSTATCNHCENQYCADHISRESHNCMGEFGATEGGPEDDPEPADERPEEQNQAVIVKESSSDKRLLAGALVIVIGVLISGTGVGIFLGFPMIFLGFAIMFPRFTVISIILAVLAFFWVLIQF